MNENRVVALRQPDEIDDPLTEICAPGASAGAAGGGGRVCGLPGQACRPPAA